MSQAKFTDDEAKFTDDEAEEVLMMLREMLRHFKRAKELGLMFSSDEASIQRFTNEDQRILCRGLIAEIQDIVDEA